MPSPAPKPSEARLSHEATRPGTAGRAMTVSERIEALIAAMTLEEKAGQLTIMPAALAPAPANAANPAAVPGSIEEQAQAVREGRLGAVFNGDLADWHRRMQTVAVEESRLGIPLLFAADVIHGFRTIFPVPLAEAAAFDADLAKRTARAAAEEATAVGLAWNFAPMVDISRDARWGRGVEGGGEDVLLGCTLAVARVEGFQGEAGLSDVGAMLATPKHLAGYGGGAGGWTTTVSMCPSGPCARSTSRRSRPHSTRAPCRPWRPSMTSPGCRPMPIRG